MKTILGILIAFIGVNVVGHAEPKEVASSQDERLQSTYSAVHRLVQRHYPEATINFVDKKIHFEWDTRLFLIHFPLKTGEWQEANEEKGPKRGGILGTIELRDGKYSGAAKVPQSFNHRYYEVMLMAPYSKAHNCHLYVHLSVPLNQPNNGFVKEFSELIQDFKE